MSSMHYASNFETIKCKLISIVIIIDQYCGAALLFSICDVMLSMV